MARPEDIRVSPDGRKVAIWNGESWDVQPAEFNAAEGVGPLEAGLIQAGGVLANLPTELLAGAQGLAGMAGVSVPGGAAAQERIEGVRQTLDPLSEEQPVASFIGGVAGGAPLAGGRALNAALGGLMGASTGDSPMERGVNAAVGVGTSLLGDQAGRMIQRAVRNRANRAGLTGGRRQANQEAVDVLRRNKVPMTRGQKTGDPRLLAEERVLSTATGRETLRGEQLTRLNEMVGDVLDIPNAEVLTPTVLGRARNKASAMFEQVADIPAIRRDAFDLGAIERKIAEESLEAGIPTRAMNQVMDAVTSPEQFTGRKLLDLRRRLGKQSSELWKKGEGINAEIIDDLVDQLDDAVEASAPELVEGLTDARMRWKLLKTLESGKAIGDSGDINPSSFQNFARRRYSGARYGEFGPGPMGDLLETLDAYQRTAKPFRSSGTAERLIPFLKGGNTVKKAGKVALGLADEALRVESAIGGAAGREVAPSVSAMVEGLLGPEPPR